MPKQEIIPPQRGQVARAEPARTADIPGVHHGGPLARYFANQNNYGQSSVNRSLTTRNLTEAELFNAQGVAADAYGNLQRRLAVLHELPEVLGHELALRRLDREGAMDQRLHDFKQAHRRHEMEALHSEADILQAKAICTRAEAVVVDAEQQLQAQRDYGYLNHELRQRQVGLEILQVQMGEEQHREYLRKFRDAKSGQPGGAKMNADELKEALHRKRQELNAAGMPTDKIDAALEALEDL